MRRLDVQVHLLAIKIYLMLHNFDLPVIPVTGGLCEECDPLTQRVFWKNLAKGFWVFFFLFTAVHCSRGMWKNGLSQVVGCECALQKEISLTETSAVACTACSSINHKLMYLMDAWKKKKKKGKMATLWLRYVGNCEMFTLFENGTARCRMKYDDHQEW